jgi:urate oxidase
MTVVLAQNAYGKSSVRLTKVTRYPDRHELTQWSIDIHLTGEFADSYIAGDNRNVIATDTMKNIVYALARQHDLAAPESFGLVLSEHFLGHYAQVSMGKVAIQVEPWERIVMDGAPHPHAFVGGAGGRRTCEVSQSRTSLGVSAGITEISLLKATDSAFRGFQRDEFTTLPEVDERILATLLNATWTYSSADGDWNELYTRVRETLLHSFAKHKSLSVQQTLYVMGKAVLEAHSGVAEISLAMPNRHNLLVNLQPFGLENPNCIFMPTSEPFGLITGTLRRE